MYEKKKDYRGWSEMSSPTQKDSADLKRSEMSSSNIGVSSFYYYPSKETSGILYVHLLKASLKLILNSQSFMGLKVLDIGSGTGWVAEEFIKHGTTSYAVDISHTACNCIRNRGSVKNFNISIICCDGENLPFRNKAFDTAIINATLHHFPTPFKALDESIRIADKLYIINEPCQTKYLDPIVAKVTKIFTRFAFLKVEANVRYKSIMDLDKLRFNLLDLRRALERRGYTVQIQRYWCYVPPFLERAENKVIVNLYKVLIIILNKAFRIFGHTFFLKATYRMAIQLDGAVTHHAPVVSY